MRLLILGGTTEASTLARHLAGRTDIEPILSLAGRTENPAASPIPVRVGGFGGVEGLIAFLRDQRIGAMVDATHPFATQISGHAAVAATHAELPLALFTRRPWTERAGDDWRHVADLDAAALAIGDRPQNVFLTSGRLGLAAFRSAPQHHYLLRSIDPPAPQDCPPRCEVILARGPFAMAEEEALMRQHGIDVLVSKNSGGRAGIAKLDAARALGVQVVMVERPRVVTQGEAFTDMDDILHWIEAHRSSPSDATP